MFSDPNKNLTLEINNMFTKALIVKKLNNLLLNIS